MARAPAIFRKADVRRAVEAVIAAGQTVARVEVDPNGKIVIVTTEVRPAVQEDLDRELSEFEARPGEG